MDANTCKNYQLCPIFNDTLKEMTTTANNYKKLYCNAGSLGWNKCKRYLVKEKTGKCPPRLLPNSSKSIEDIVLSMN